jgi:glutathione peroxidase
MPITRRDALALLGAAMAAPALAAAPASRVTAHAFGFDRPSGPRIDLAAHAGKPVLVVNTATACGFAPQLAGLQGLWTRFGTRGLLVLAVPSNDFGGQEPHDGEAVAEAARAQYGATFPFAARTPVRGPLAHPFYRWAAAERPGETPRWNFHKYLIGPDGALAASFPTSVEPADPRIVRAVGAALEGAA